MEKPTINMVVGFFMQFCNEVYNVVYANSFDITNGKHGNEYILEKETKDEE